MQTRDFAGSFCRVLHDHYIAIYISECSVYHIKSNDLILTLEEHLFLHLSHKTNSLGVIIPTESFVQEFIRWIQDFKAHFFGFWWNRIRQIFSVFL